MTSFFSKSIVFCDGICGRKFTLLGINSKGKSFNGSIINDLNMQLNAYLARYELVNGKKLIEKSYWKMGKYK